MVTLIAVRNAVRTARSITLIQLIQQFDSEQIGRASCRERVFRAV